MPQWFPRFLGRCLYWVGVALELLALARQISVAQFVSTTNFTILRPIITIGASQVQVQLPEVIESGL
ncbi:MAG: hypothetical protein ACHBN1_16450 [Heteroscytonema crispum UTEX LB 1556]